MMSSAQGSPLRPPSRLVGAPPPGPGLEDHAPEPISCVAHMVRSAEAANAAATLCALQCSVGRLTFRRRAETQGPGLASPDGLPNLSAAADARRRATERQLELIRRLALGALTAERARFLDCLEVMDQAVEIADPTGRIAFCNRAARRLWGWAPPDGRPWCGAWRLQRADGSALPAENGAVAQCLAEDKAVGGHFAFALRPDGTRVPFAAYATPLHRQGVPVGAVHVLADLSAGRRAAA
jgi:PAS domain-containing protein